MLDKRQIIKTRASARSKVRIYGTVRAMHQTSRGRIVAALQRGGLTIDDLAERLGVTANAVRVQIALMERDGVVHKVGRRAGTTRPFQIYALTAEVEQLLSKAYIPVLTHIVRVFADGLPTSQAESMLRAAGVGLADELLAGRKPSGSLRARVFAAKDLLNDQLGATTEVVENGEYVLQGVGCPLAAVSGKHPAICLALEGLVSAIVGAPVRECCDRSARPRCCFKIRKRRERP